MASMRMAIISVASEKSINGDSMNSRCGISVFEKMNKICPANYHKPQRK